MIVSYPRRRRTRAAAALLAVLAGLAGGLAAVPPAAACACGAVVTNDGVRVGEETALIRHDGATEEITMGLVLDGEARDAAWLLPVPARPAFDLAPDGLFAQLDRITRPRVERRRDWFPSLSGAGDGGAGTGAPGGATVVARSRVGPYDVATLAAGDGDGLRRWLSGHGYPLDPAVAGAADPYAADGWLFVAVRLVPAETGDRLSPALPPLRVRFASDAIVYPMRLTALAGRPQSVRLYVLAAHRVRAAGPVGPTEAELRFAGRVDPGSLTGPLVGAAGGPGAAPGSAGPLFLTRFDQYIAEPGTVTDDYRFVAAPADTPYRDVVVETEPVYLLGLPAGPVLIALGLGLAAALVLAVRPVLAATRRRRPRRA